MRNGTHRLNPVFALLLMGAGLLSPEPNAHAQPQPPQQEEVDLGGGRGEQ